MFDGRHYEIRQKFGIGNRYAIYEEGGDDPILTSAQKKFRLKEDFRFADPATGEERFRVRADSVLDLTAAYDVVAADGERVGSVERSVASFLRHEYALYGPEGEQVATVVEDSTLRALVRRLLTSLLPFSYVVRAPDGRELGRISGAFSLRDRYAVDVDGDLDPRLAVIAAVVIDAIEEN